ncbi:sodium:proton antiporter [Fructobacillus sp. M1-13]|uniref:Sodium:proton antiporter n=1 Tax=Fructobacillus papyriferae TaxID=2713171 RepID=A0ABS5QPI1_9LACO|nr:sodium:proton antiporter [Fructobacillus papyriferae]MBS9335080.1 sodium:proton antiporter [Fructobacillus papyriferae]MCD2159434.1 sodium:proton antiporter [Fructobacillus papyriferae]
MSQLYLIALLLLAVIAANIVKPFIPRVPEALVLIAVGGLFTAIPVFRGFELDPEFFLFLIIAPLMFQEGQGISFATMKKHFNAIFQLSVILALFVVAIVAMITDKINADWPLTLAIALAAIVVPTDAVAVKSMTTGLKMPKGLNQSLELESLFNDATGIVLLDLALSVYKQGSFNLTEAIGHFVIVALGGLIVGALASAVIVALRLYLSFHASSAQATTIPLNILTPFAIYLLAEHFHLSGILAVVAAGIVHNYEQSRLQLIATESRVVSGTIWQTLTTLLNGVVFVILGLSMPKILNLIGDFGFSKSLGLFWLAILIYLAMYAARYLWVTFQKQQRLVGFFGKHQTKDRAKRAQIFGIAGVHGAVTLALAMSLPKTVHGQPLPFLNEILLVSTLVILISLIAAAFVLPQLLDKEEKIYSDEELNQARSAMIDSAIIQVEQRLTDHATKTAIVQTLQTQKLTVGHPKVDHEQSSLVLLTKISDELQAKLDQMSEEGYDQDILDRYGRFLQRGLLSPAASRHPLVRFNQQLHHLHHELAWHWKTKTFTRAQRLRYREKLIQENPKIAQKVARWKSGRLAMLAINDEMQQLADRLLSQMLQKALDEKKDTEDVAEVRLLLERFFRIVAHDNRQENVAVKASEYIQAFADEYAYLSTQLAAGQVKAAVADELYTEINQAQTLLLMERGESEEEAVVTEEEASRDQ